MIGRVKYQLLLNINILKKDGNPLKKNHISTIIKVTSWKKNPHITIWDYGF